MTEYRHLQVARQGAVGWLWLNRPEQRNALSGDMWEDLPRAVSDLSEGPETRAIVVAARGPAFTVGIDLALLASLQPQGRSDSDAKSNLYRLRHREPPRGRAATRGRDRRQLAAGRTRLQGGAPGR